MEKKTYEERLYEMAKRYTINDIKRLLGARIDAAGLLVMPMFAGMITLGHVLYGFKLTDRDVFTKFCRYRMKICVKLAEILYDNVYHGLTVMWCSHSHVTLLNSETNPLWSSRLVDDGIVVNALGLAKLYIKTAGNLPEYQALKKHYLADEEFGKYREQIALLRSIKTGE